jgi:hypothetical protein
VSDTSLRVFVSDLRHFRDMPYDVPRLPGGWATE